MTNPTLGLLHTSSANRDRFSALLREMSPGDVTVIHNVREELLREALDDVPEARQVAAISAALAELHASGARQVLCTCSSIGRLAELAGARLGLPTLRVDRPMAERAVSLGRRILVVACLPSTLIPTTALLREAADESGRAIDIETMFLPSAWRLFLQGDEAGFARSIASAVLDSPLSVDVAVLAQASMAPATELLAGLAVPVLSSPRLGVAAALARLTGRPAEAPAPRRSGEGNGESPHA
jgi:hypothetical protein